MSIRAEYLVRKNAEHPTKDEEFSSLPDNPQIHPALFKKEQLLSWPTPTQRDWKGAYSEESQANKLRHLLPDAVLKSWPTPTASEGIKIGSQPNYGQLGLGNHPAIVGLPLREKINKNGKSPDSWPTPTASTGGPGENQENPRGNHQGNPLATTVNWSTPQTRDYRSGHPNRREDPQRSKNLNDQMEKVNAKLSPDWVAQLMGLTTFHTQLPLTWGRHKIESIGSACWGMGSLPKQPQKHL